MVGGVFFEIPWHWLLAFKYHIQIIQQMIGSPKSSNIIKPDTTLL
jgi:hypothetical protein